MSCVTCDVCKEVKSKYKCPSCLAPYCSLGCYKKHKEIPCAKAQPPVEKIENTDPPRSYEVDEQSWVVDKEQLRTVAESSDIRVALKNEDLRKLILKINSSEDPENELTKIMQGGGIFQEFTEKILNIVNPQESS